MSAETKGRFERSDQEVLAFYTAHKRQDWLGTLAGDLLSTLPAEAVRPYLKEDADLEAWKPAPRDRASVVERMRAYMEFAWDKALGHRGISAGRSIDHYRAWLFLVGDDELLAYADDIGNYPQYGAPILMRICEEYGFGIPDDPAARRMAEGKPCYRGCVEGCDR